MLLNFTNEDFSLLLSNQGDLFLKFLFDKYYNELCRLAFRYTGRSDVAEDVVQEVFINIWNKRHSLDYKGNIKPCLIRSTINTSINYLKSKYGSLIFEEIANYSSIKSELDHYEVHDTMELEKLLEIAIGNLPEKCREIFVMSRLSCLTHKEISETIYISTKTIEAQITIALKKIHHFLTQMGYFPFFLFLLK